MTKSRIEYRYKESKIYAFSNENLTSFGKIYDFDGASVLTVLGSGDQYFASKLFGAKTVEVYDSNPNTWFHFVLKFYAIRILSYEEFYELFVESRLSSINILNKIFPYLPYDILSRIQRILKNDFSEIMLYSSLSDFHQNYQSGRITPYFDKDNYYALQHILRNTELPKMHNNTFLDLPKKLGNKPFDILLASNIYRWLVMTPEEYDEFLNKFNAGTIQAYYSWHYNSHIENFLNLGYQIDPVEPTNPYERNSNNFVITKKN